MKITHNSFAFGNLSRSINCALLTLLVCVLLIEYKPIFGRPRSSSGKSTLELLTREARIAKGAKSGKSNKSIRLPYLRLREVPQTEIVAQETSTHILQCEAGGSPIPTIHWLKNGKKITQGESNQFNEEEDNVKKGELSLSFTRSRLYLDCVHPKDEAIYTCVASSPFDRVSADSHLKVIPNLRSSDFTNEADNSVSRCLAKKSYGYPARIHMWTHNILELIGSDVQLYCRSSGLPQPTTSWIGPDDNPILNSQKYKILESGDLLIRELVWEDMGNYMCIAENQHGSDRTTIFLYPTLPEDKK